MRMVYDLPMIEIPDWFLLLVQDRPLMFARTPQPWNPYVYEHINMPLSVICTGNVESDGKRWLHVSCSRRNRLPSWEELRLVKDTFIGKDRKAISVLPCEGEYVNDHPFVLHLFSCLDGDGLPDFRTEGTL